MGWRKFSGGGCAVVQVEGRVDGSTWPAFHAFLASAVKEAANDHLPLRIDLSRLDYISTHGLRVLTGVVREAAQNVPVTLSAPTGPVREILDLTGVGSLFTIEN